MRVPALRADPKDRPETQTALSYRMPGSPLDAHVENTPCQRLWRSSRGPIRPRLARVKPLVSVALFALAALAEIGGAWLVWQSVREARPWWWAGLGVMALGAYGFVAAFQPEAHFGRVLAAYGGVFIAGSLAWGVIVDGFRPDRWDLAGAAVCLLGVALIMFAPRQG